MEVEILDSAPLCLHGPTLLFTPPEGKKSGEKYYACSACRDRKTCSFFLPAYKAKQKYEFYRQLFDSNLAKKERHINKAEQVLQEKQKQRGYCHTCSLLMLPSEIEDHSTHVIQTNLKNSLLEQPSQLLKPLENDKKEAQYFFSNSSLQLVVDTFLKLGFHNFLCVGTPRVAEFIRGRDDCSALLLDLDRRFEQFYPESQYAWYNMFNNYFFYESGKEAAKSFLSDKSKKTIVMIDPPFGGLVKPLATSLQQLAALAGQEELPFVWFAPYFLGNHITQHLPGAAMLDYVVEYQNHPVFWKDIGSPVRIFTNIEASKIVFPPELGFWFCEPCQRYSGPNNKHCKTCNKCPSRNGQASKHCPRCKRCVKATFTHCPNCRKCHQDDDCQAIKLSKERKSKIKFSEAKKLKLKKKKIVRIRNNLVG